jgi:signal peptidase I
VEVLAGVGAAVGNLYMRRLKYALPCCLIVVVTFWSLLPILKDPFHNVSGVVDSGLIVWVINQTVLKIPSDIGNIFNGNIFYPYKNTLAYSDMLIVSAILSYLPVKITGEPVFANTFTLVSGQILTITIIYLWWREISGNTWSSLIAALSFGLSQIRFVYSAHLQMWNMQWFLLSAYFFWKFDRSKKRYLFYLALLFAVIQAWESLFPLVLILLVDIVVAHNDLQTLVKKYWRHFILIFSLFIILTFPVLSTYFQVAQEFSYVRPIREVAHFSMGVDELLGDYFSPALFGLFIFVVVAKWKTLVKNKKELIWIMVVLVVSFIFALGPVLKWQGSTVKIFSNIFIPLPYGILYYVFPFLKAFRTASRYIWLTGFAMSGIIALGLKEFNFRKNKLALLAFFAIPIIFSGKITQIYKIPSKSEYPSVYSWLKEQPGDVILELPIYTWANGDITQKETNRMIFSLYHGKKLVNGYSGFFPPEWLDFVAKINRNFPNDETDELLHKRGVNYIVVDKQLITFNVLSEIKRRYFEKKIWEDKDYVVFGI